MAPHRPKSPRLPGYCRHRSNYRRRSACRNPGQHLFSRSRTPPARLFYQCRPLLQNLDKTRSPANKPGRHRYRRHPQPNPSKKNGAANQPNQRAAPSPRPAPLLPCSTPRLVQRPTNNQAQNGSAPCSMLQLSRARLLRRLSLPYCLASRQSSPI